MHHHGIVDNQFGQLMHAGGTHICKVYGDVSPKWVGFSEGLTKKIPK